MECVASQKRRVESLVEDTVDVDLASRGIARVKVLRHFAPIDDPYVLGEEAVETAHKSVQFDLTLRPDICYLA